MTTEERVLIVYYSRTGKTERVATDLAARLHADIERIDDKAKRGGFFGYMRAVYDSARNIAADIAKPHKDPADYAITVVGTPVWGWKMTPAARGYLERTGGRARALAFFVTSGNTDAGKIVPAMEAIGGARAIAFTGFNEAELKDPATYESKLATFIAALESRARKAA